VNSKLNLTKTSQKKFSVKFKKYFSTKIECFIYEQKLTKSVQKNYSNFNQKYFCTKSERFHFAPVETKGFSCKNFFNKKPQKIFARSSEVFTR
jgi:hypothetical protein